MENKLIINKYMKTIKTSIQDKKDFLENLKKIQEARNEIKYKETQRYLAMLKAQEDIEQEMHKPYFEVIKKDTATIKEILDLSDRELQLLIDLDVHIYLSCLNYKLIISKKCLDEYRAAIFICPMTVKYINNISREHSDSNFIVFSHGTHDSFIFMHNENLKEKIFADLRDGKYCFGELKKMQNFKYCFGGYNE